MRPANPRHSQFCTRRPIMDQEGGLVLPSRSFGSAFSIVYGIAKRLSRNYGGRVVFTRPYHGDSALHANHKSVWTALRRRTVGDSSGLAGPSGTKSIAGRLRTVRHALSGGSFLCMVLRDRPVHPECGSCPHRGEVLVHSAGTLASHPRHGTGCWYSGVLLSFHCPVSDVRAPPPP